MPKYTFDDISVDYGVGTADPKAVGLAAVRYSIDNILRTTPGERVFLPQFGSGIYRLLFRPITPTTERLLWDAVRGSIKRWEPRVKLIENRSFIRGEPDNNLYRITLTYEIKSTGQIDQYISIIETFTQ